MANGTVYNTKQELLDAIQALVYENDDNETTSDNIQKASKDIVESVWDRSTPLPTGTAFQTLKYNGFGVLIADSNVQQDPNGIVIHRNLNSATILAGRQESILYAVTTDATTTPLKLSPTDPGIFIPANSVCKVRVEVVGYQTGGSAGTIGDSTTRVIQGAMKNTSGTPTGIGAGLSVADVIEDAALSGYVLTSSTAPGILNINVAGQANKTIQWTALVTLTIINVL